MTIAVTRRHLFVYTIFTVTAATRRHLFIYTMFTVTFYTGLPPRVRKREYSCDMQPYFCVHNVHCDLLFSFFVYTMFTVTPSGAEEVP